MANLLTAVRLVLILPVSLALAQPLLLDAGLVLGMILAAIVTDYFDGKVARATGSASARGQLFDHGTDFLFVTSGLGGLAYAGLISPYLAPLIAAAFTQYVLDSHYLYHQKQLRMSFLGRWNGIFYFGPLLLFALARLPVLAAWEAQLAWLGASLAQVLVVSTIASIIDRAVAPLRHPER